MRTSPLPKRGDIWTLDLNPVRGHEQAGRRPALVVSVDAFSQGPAGLVIIIPVTSRRKGIPFHVQVRPPEGGMRIPSFIKCEDVRSVARDRLMRRCGTVSPQTMEEVEERLRILMDL